jgi:hypothetical protein
MIVAVKLAVDGPPVLIDRAADLLGFLQVSNDQPSRPAQAFGSGGVLDGAIEIRRPEDSAEIFLHEECKGVMAEGWFAACDQFVEIGAVVSRRMVGCLEIGGIFGFGTGDRESAQSIEMSLEIPLHGGLPNVRYCRRRQLLL